MTGSSLGEQEVELKANSTTDDTVTVAGRGSQEGEWPGLTCPCWIGRVGRGNMVGLQGYLVWVCLENIKQGIGSSKWHYQVQ